MHMCQNGPRYASHALVLIFLDQYPFIGWSSNLPYKASVPLSHILARSMEKVASAFSDFV